MTAVSRHSDTFDAPSLQDPNRRTYPDEGRVFDTSKVAPADARVLTRIFLDRLRRLEEGTAEYQYVRNTLIEMNQSLVRFAASRFRHREPHEADDIFQVGVIGLIKAIDRFDLTRNVEFSTLALPYIRGEIRRHFRDTTWAVHVPRRLQELRVELAKAKEHLASVLDAEPSVAELAAYMEIPEREVVDAMAASNGYTAASIDSGGPSEDGGPEVHPSTYADSIGAEDPALALFEDCHALAPLLKKLSAHELRLLRLRFGEERTQQQIGDAVGCSQMHVSRQLAQIFGKLREGLLDTSR